MRDLVLSTVIFAALPVAFLRPWIGVLLCSWIGYMNPHRLTWGFAYNIPFAKIAAIATLAGLLLSGEVKPLPRTRSTTLLLAFWPWIKVTTIFFILPRTRSTTLLLAFWAWITLTTIFSNYPNLAWSVWEEVSKTLLITLLTMLLFQEVKKIWYLVLTIALSIAFFGVKSGLAGLLAGFSYMVYAYPPDTFFADNNHMALALNLVLPLLLLLAQEERRPLFKGVFYAISGLTVLGVLSTFSRGGFVGLAITIVMLVLRSRRKAMGLTIIFLGGLLVASVLSASWYDRISSIAEYRQDRSAQDRIEAWTVATRLALDSPLTGGGFRTLQPEIYWRYGYDAVDKEREAHSIFFQVLSEQGFVGLGIFVALLGSTLISLGRVARMTAVPPAAGEIGRLARAIQTSLIAFMVSGAFLSRAYFDLVYQLIAITAVLTKLARQRLSTVSKATEQGVVVLGQPLPGRVG